MTLVAPAWVDAVQEQLATLFRHDRLRGPVLRRREPGRVLLG